jgi:hypothetical protein
MHITFRLNVSSKIEQFIEFEKLQKSKQNVLIIRGEF